MIVALADLDASLTSAVQALAAKVGWTVTTGADPHARVLLAADAFETLLPAFAARAGAERAVAIKVLPPIAPMSDLALRPASTAIEALALRHAPLTRVNGVAPSLDASADDVAQVIAFLVGVEAITGQVLVADVAPS